MDSWLKISTDNLVHNIKFFVETGNSLCAVVKANGYGIGSVKLAEYAVDNGAHMIATATIQEAIKLRKHNITVPIMLLQQPQLDEYVLCAKYSIEPTVFTLEHAWKALTYNLGIHINVNTGMNRIGIPLNKAEKFIEQVTNVKSVYTHLATSDTDKTYTLQQLEKFNNLNVSSYLTHSANTAGHLHFLDKNFGMSRIGIGLHGIDPANISTELKPVTEWKTIVSHSHHVKQGERVGYRNIEIKEPTWIVTAKTGYADGYPKALKDFYAVHKQTKLKVLDVAMDQIMLASSYPINETETISLLGGEHNSWQEAALHANTVPYELLTGIGNRVHRIW